MFAGHSKLVKNARKAPIPGQNNKNDTVKISPRKKTALAISHNAHIGNIKIPPLYVEIHSKYILIIQ